MKSQIVILKVRFDEDSLEPKSWNWSEILGCDKDCVEVVNHGVVEETN